MNTATKLSNPDITIDRADTALPILIATGPRELAIRPGTTIRIGETTHRYDEITPIDLGDLVSGTDYAVTIDTAGTPLYAPVTTYNPLGNGGVAGFHFAPGSNATARDGGGKDSVINPHSIWDVGFRFAGPDPRGMVLVDIDPEARIWVDIYLLGKDHARDGTSRHGVTIADGRSLDRLNYKDAVDIYASHGKRLLTYDEFKAAAYGIKERSSADRDPNTTGLDADRTSRYGLMQATGNLWQWGTDGDPDDPRPSIFGGSWIDGSCAGSRYACLDYWPGHSRGNLSARGAGDHLSPA